MYSSTRLTTKCAIYIDNARYYTAKCSTPHKSLRMCQRSFVSVRSRAAEKKRPPANPNSPAFRCLSPVLWKKVRRGCFWYSTNLPLQHTRMDAHFYLARKTLRYGTAHTAVINSTFQKNPDLFLCHPRNQEKKQKKIHAVHYRTFDCVR